MDCNAVGKILHSSLPEDIYGSNVENPEQKIEQMLENDLPNGDKSNIKHDLFWRYELKPEAKKKIKSNKHKKFLTRKERYKQNLLKLPKHGWNYNELENMRQMWREYMHDNLEKMKIAPKCTDQNWSNFSIVLSRSELIGAEIMVVRSNVPNLIGLKGTVVLETKSTFQIVTPNNALKVLLKEPSVFCFELEEMRFTIFGKHITTRPAERSVKKIKTVLHPDL